MSIVRAHVFVGVLLSIIAFVMIQLDSALFKVFGSAFVIAIAYAIGDSKALTLRLLAQFSLCFVQIEENTRRPSP